MWVVTGTGQSGKTYRYDVPAPMNSDKMMVAVIAYQEHGTKFPDDAMKVGATVEWQSDQVVRLDEELEIDSKWNYSLEVYNENEKVWAKVGARAFQREDAVERALEEEASANPDRKYRVRGYLRAEVITMVSKNASHELEDHMPPAQEQTEIPVDTPKKATSEKAA